MGKVALERCPNTPVVPGVLFVGRLALWWFG